MKNFSLALLYFGVEHPYAPAFAVRRKALMNAFKGVRNRFERFLFHRRGGSQAVAVAWKPNACRLGPRPSDHGSS